MSFQSLLIHRANLQREVESVSGLGVRTVTWSNIRTQFRCRIQPLSANQVNSARIAGFETTHRLYCETEIPATSATTNMVVLITGTQAAPRARYRITKTVNARTFYYEITGVYDTDHLDRICVIDLVERQFAYFNPAAGS